jgi:DNA-binding NarL/FixJ family response regulator
MARVGALVPDLLFGSRVKGALEAAGHEVDLFDQEDTARARAPACDVLIVDLGSADVDGATLVESMLMGRELGETRTLGFYPHVDAATRVRALQAGFDLVVPRSRMAREGASLVAELAAGRDG